MIGHWVEDGMLCFKFGTLVCSTICKYRFDCPHHWDYILKLLFFVCSDETIKATDGVPGNSRRHFRSKVEARTAYNSALNSRWVQIIPESVQDTFATEFQSFVVSNSKDEGLLTFFLIGFPGLLQFHFEVILEICCISPLSRHGVSFLLWFYEMNKKLVHSAMRSLMHPFLHNNITMFWYQTYIFIMAVSIG